MIRKVCTRLIFVSFAAAMWCVAATADQPRLHIEWPSDWEFQQVSRQELPYIELRGRHRVDGVLRVSIRIVDARNTPEAITKSETKDLARKLRDRFGSESDASEFQQFANARGYYFVVTDRRSKTSPPYKHLIEGVMLDSGYLVEFVLQSNDAHAPETLTMLSALEKFTIR